MPNITSLSIVPPTSFSFELTVCSHGWLVLAPNAWDHHKKLLARPMRLSDGEIVLVSMCEALGGKEQAVQIEAKSPLELSPAQQQEIRLKVAHILRLDEDLTGFYVECERRGGHWKGALIGAGRLLRSPTVFEDVVKTICTTNIQWSGTVKMVERLVDGFGEPFAGDGSTNAFPTPERIAESPFEAFKATARAGYRAAYIHELATRIAQGELDLELLLDRETSASDLKKQLLAIKGVGPYACATLLMLLGRYEELGVDTEFRDFVSRKYFDGKKVPDKQMKAIYEDWGEWKYLACWFEVWSKYRQRVRESSDPT